MGDVCVEKVQFDPGVERRILNRLRRIEGQVRGVQRLVAEHAPCDDVLIQIAAMRQAMGAVAVELLEGHLDVCVAEQVEKGDGAKILASVKGVLSQVLRQGV